VTLQKLPICLCPYTGMPVDATRVASDRCHVKVIGKEPRLLRVNTFWCQRDKKAANNTIRPPLKQSVPSFYAVDFVLRAICKNKLATLGESLDSPHASSLLVDCFMNL